MIGRRIEMDQTHITVFRLSPAELKQMLNLKDESLLVSIKLEDEGRGHREVVIVFNKRVE